MGSAVGLLADGSVILQNRFKGVSGEFDPLITHISAYGVQDGSPFETAKTTITFLTANATNGLVMDGSKQFTITKGAGGNITINKIKLYLADGSSFIEIGEVDTTSTLFTANGIFTLQSLALKFPNQAWVENATTQEAYMKIKGTASGYKGTKKGGKK